MAKKRAKKEPPVDGLGPRDIKKIRSALRQVWSWSHPRKLVIKRCTGDDGFLYCEACNARAPKIHVDHMVNVGEVNSGFIARLFVSSKRMTGLCVACHKVKTSGERKRMAKARKAAKSDIADFY